MINKTVFLRKNIYQCLLTEKEVVKLFSPDKIVKLIEKWNWDFMYDNQNGSKMFYKRKDETILIPKKQTSDYFYWLMGFLKILCEIHHVSLEKLINKLKKC